MTAPVLVEPEGPVAPEAPNRPAEAGRFVLAGMTSLGAGVIHLAAIGPHADDPAAAGTFAVVGLAQLAWGAAALTARRTWVGIVGLVLSMAAVGGWVLAKTTGIGFITGLDHVESIQRADAAAALLAAVTALIVARRLLVGDAVPQHSRRAMVAVGVAIAAVALLGMGSTPGHQHVHGADLGPIGHGHGADLVPPLAYDPSEGVDLSGIPGVTAGEQAAAEQLVRSTLRGSPSLDSAAAARAAGYRPVTTVRSGTERWIRWASLEDDHQLDPDHPEALLFDVDADGSRTLVAVEYLLVPGSPLDAAPVPGGALTAWQTIDDLCLRGSGARAAVEGVASVDGTCAPPTEPIDPVPALHAWVVPHPCGPFSSIESAEARTSAGAALACGGGHGG